MTRKPAVAPMTSPLGRPIFPWVCTDDRNGVRMHVDARGNMIHGPSQLPHKGGQLTCPDGRTAGATTTTRSGR